MKDRKILVAYFSASGETAKLSKTLSDVAGADLYEIVPQEKYSSADLNWNDKNSRSSKEMANVQARPAISGNVENMEQYEVVFVGFPIWWGEAPRIIATFLENYDFSGKTVIPFATSGGSGFGKTDSILQKLCPASVKWLPGALLKSNADKETVKKWVDELKI